MTRDDILDKAAKAMHESYGPIQARDSRWITRSIATYRRRFKTGLDVVEDDLRRDERNHVTAWLRAVAARPGMGARSAAEGFRAIADELDQLPIGEQLR